MDLVQLRFYSGELLQYLCEAPAVVAKTIWSVVNGALTGVSVTSDVATATTVADHGLYVGAHATITDSLTAELNGDYVVASVPSSKTFTVATVGVPDTAAADGETPAVSYDESVIETYDPRLTAEVWRVTIYRYTSTSLTSTLFGGGAKSLNFRAKASDRATL